MGDPVFATNLAATLFLTGVIWFVQIVHYPLFVFYRDPAFPVHARRTGWVVAGPMLVELATQFVLLNRHPKSAAYWIGAALLATIWGSTWALQIPRHNRLAQGFDAPTCAALVRGNWLRTVAWSMRAILMIGCAVQGA